MRIQDLFETKPDVESDDFVLRLWKFSPRVFLALKRYTLAKFNDPTWELDVSSYENFEPEEIDDEILINFLNDLIHMNGDISTLRNNDSNPEFIKLLGETLFSFWKFEAKKAIKDMKLTNDSQLTKSKIEQLIHIMTENFTSWIDWFFTYKTRRR